MTVIHPVPFARPGHPAVTAPQTALQRATTAIVRRTLPVVAASAASLVATLAAERAVRQVALNLIERVGGMPVDGGRHNDDFARTVVTEITVVERIRRRA